VVKVVLIFDLNAQPDIQNLNGFSAGGHSTAVRWRMSPHKREKSFIFFVPKKIDQLLIKS